MWNTVSEIGTRIWVAEHILVAKSIGGEKGVCINLEYIFHDHQGLLAIISAKKYKYK